MRTIVGLLVLIVIGGTLPTGLYGLGHLPGAAVLSGAALLMLLAACILTGCMLTRVGHGLQEAKHLTAPDPSGARARVTKSALRRAAHVVARPGSFGAPHLGETEGNQPAGDPIVGDPMNAPLSLGAETRLWLPETETRFSPPAGVGRGVARRRERVSTLRSR